MLKAVGATAGSAIRRSIALIGEGRLSVTWIDEVVRVAAAVGAAVAFYVAWFVYEDEEKKLQNKIETWWIQFDDFRGHLVSGQAAFLIVVALRANEILDRLFGPKLIGKDAIAVATSLTIGSAYLVGALMHAIVVTHYPGGWSAGACAVILLACVFAPLATPRLRILPRVIMWLFVAWAVVANSVVLLYVAWSLLTGRSVEHFSSFLHDPGPGIPMAAVGTLASIALTICQVAVARRAMRATVAAKSEWPLVAGMLVVTVPIGILLAASIWVIFRAASHGVDVFAVTSATALMISALFIACGCLVSVALGALVAAVASMMLLHRLIWPLANRLLYALGRYRLVQNKLALNAVGATLTGIAITGTYGWQAILSHFGVA